MKLKSSTIIFFISFFFLFLFVNIDNVFANEIGKNIVAEMINKFKGQNAAWYNPVKAFATDLFFVILLFEFVWTSIMAALQQMETADYLRNFVKIVFFGLIFLAIINNYQEWSNSIINGLGSIINKHMGSEYQADDPFNVALTLYDNMQKITAPMKGLDYIATVLACYLCMLIIMIIFALITAKVIVINCEILIGLLGGLLLIPFGASSMFKEFAINSMKYVLSVGFKLFMMNLIIAISFTFVKDFSFSEEYLLSDCLILIGFSIVLLCISFTLPDTIASLVSSAHGSSGNMLQALSTVANATTAAAAGAMAITSIPGKIAGGAVDTARGGKEVWDTFKNAKGKGVWDTTKNLGKEALALRDQAKLNNSSIGKELLNRHNARKIQPKK